MSIPIIRKAVQCGLKDMLLTDLEKKDTSSTFLRTQNAKHLSTLWLRQAGLWKYAFIQHKAPTQ